MAYRVIDVKDQTKDPESDTLATLIRTAGGLGQEAIGLLKTFLELPLSNPTMAAVIGIVTNDILSHQVDWLHWTHKEYYCTNCNVFVSIYDWLTGSHDMKNLVYQTVPGVLTGAANLQIAAIILSSYAVSEVGSVLSDITQITKITGNSNPPASITAPSLKFLSKGSQKATAGLQDIEGNA